jgi:hypothetical protein
MNLRIAVPLLAAIGLTVAGFAAWRHGAPAEVRPAPAVRAEGAPPETAAPVAEPAGPERFRLLALKALDLIVDSIRKQSGDKVLAASLEREAQDLGRRLQAELKADPSLWPSMVEILNSLDDLEAAGKLLGMVVDAMDDAAERAFIDALRSGSTVHSRRLAVAALVRRSSAASLSALMDAARSDPSPLVRMDALRALALRRDQAGSDAVKASVEDFWRSQVGAEQDPELQNMARRLLGEPIDPIPAPRPSSRPGIKIRKATPKPPSAAPTATDR